MTLDVDGCVAEERATKERGTMVTIDVRSLTSLGTRTRCPVCRGTDVRWFGILRVCVACANVFHWRDAANEH
jgi:hypothetical protein